MSGDSGIRITGMALFMSCEQGMVGISFCRPESSDRAMTSPELALLIKGSTSKTSIKCTKIDALTVQTDGDQTYRVVWSQNKAIALFQWGRACSMLSKLSKEGHHDDSHHASKQKKIFIIIIIIV